jgi:hypothetical protein
MQIYTIYVADILDKRWKVWLGDYIQDITISDQDGKMVLTVFVPDQAALRGLLNKLWDLNLTLLSVIREDSESEKEE